MTAHLPCREPPLWGGAARLVTAAVGASGAGNLTLVEAMVLFAILVVVPLALPLLPVSSRANSALALVAGAPTASALLLEQGVPAGLLALPWLAFSARRSTSTTPASPHRCSPAVQ